jgi:hypothetical protein
MRSRYGTESVNDLPRLAVVVLGAAFAVWVLWLSVHIHLQRACVLLDTPYLPICKSAPNATDSSRQQQLRVRLAADPGDSHAWIELASVERGMHERALLRAAFALAPTDPNVLMWRAGDALSSNNLPAATALLVELVQNRNSGQAAQALARIVASGEGIALLRPHMSHADRWMPQVLASFAPLKLPLTAALSLVSEASAAGKLSATSLQSYIAALKSDGKWGDAYGLWIAQQRRAVPLLYNGGFEEPFQPNGFDWELPSVSPSRAGAVVTRRGSVDKGQVLDVEFTGRPLVVPIIRQYIFAPPGKYLLKGRYRTSRLRSEQGLAWIARCQSGSPEAGMAGRSPGLQESGGAWREFEFSITVSPQCGQVFSLQLETFAPFEAATGLKGRVAFDALELMPDRV